MPSIMNQTQQLNCAGRSLIGSSALKELGIEHYICSPDQHSILLAKTERGYCYCDPQQGLLVEGIPFDAIQFDRDAVSRGTVATIDVKKCPTATVQGLGYMHKSFLIFSPAAGISEQGMSNTRTAIQQQWIKFDDQDEELEKISVEKDRLFPGTDEPDIDQLRSRASELVQLFQMLANNDWSINDQIIAFNRDHELYPLSKAEDFSGIVEKLRQWRSRGEADEIAQGIAALTGKQNVEGAGLDSFFEKQS